MKRFERAINESMASMKAGGSKHIRCVCAVFARVSVCVCFRVSFNV